MAKSCNYCVLWCTGAKRLFLWKKPLCIFMSVTISTKWVISPTELICLVSPISLEELHDFHSFVLTPFKVAAGPKMQKILIIHYPGVEIVVQLFPVWLCPVMFGHHVPFFVFHFLPSVLLVSCVSVTYLLWHMCSCLHFKTFWFVILFSFCIFIVLCSSFCPACSFCFYCLLLPAFVEMFGNHSLLPAKPNCFDFKVTSEGDSDEHLALLFGLWQVYSVHCWVAL